MYSTRIYKLGRSNAGEPHFLVSFPLPSQTRGHREENKQLRPIGRKVKRPNPISGLLHKSWSPTVLVRIFSYPHNFGRVRGKLSSQLFHSTARTSKPRLETNGVTQVTPRYRTEKANRKQTWKAKKPTRAERSITCKVQSHNDMNT